MAKIGVAIISDGQPWEQNRDIIRRMKPEIIRVRTPSGFSFTPEQLDDIITDNPMLRTIVLGTEDAVVTPEQVESEIVGRGFYEVIKRNPTVDAVLELGNEHNLKGVNTWTHRYDALQTLQQLKPRLALPNLRWSVSLPTTLSDTIDLLSRDQHGCILDHIDVHTAHWYGWYEIGDGAGDRGKWNDILDYLVRHTTLPILITEAGIDDRATPRDEKARRYLSWAATAHPRIEGACFWGIGEWSQNSSFEIDAAMADVLGSRSIPTPQPEPQPEPEPDMPLTLDTEWLGRDGTTAEQIVAAIFDHGQPAYSREQVETYAASMVYRTREFGLRTLAVAAQSAVETGWLQFGNQVKPDQFNFGGIGADDSGAAGSTNPTIDHGIVQMCVHHLAYQLGMPDKWPAELRQYAHTNSRIDDVQALLTRRGLLNNRPRRIRDYGNGIWATDPNYSAKIVDRSRAIARQSEQPEQEQPPVGINIIIDHFNGSNRPHLPMTARYITVHETANTGKGANALMHSRFLKNGGGSSGVSFHYVVDDHEVRELMPPNEAAWHAGDGYNGTGNRASIAIETCVNRDGNWPQTVENLAQLVAVLMGRHGIPLARVVPHRHWSGKFCPTRLLQSGWDQLIQRVRDIAANAGYQETPVFERNFPGTEFKIVGGFRRYFEFLEEHLGPTEAILVTGLALGNEYVDPADGITKQDFERVRMEWHKDARPDRWDVLLGRVNAELKELQGAA